MSNYIEYKDKMAFHPGYYIKEFIDETGLTQEEFAIRLGTTPKNISILVRGEQSISVDIATKLSRMLGTSVVYWLNIQNMYDSVLAEMNSDELLNDEKEIFKSIDYSYFRKYFGLPDLLRKTDEQIKELRTFLNVSSLTYFNQPNLEVSFRNASEQMTAANTIRANMMVQIASNLSLKDKTNKFNKKAFEEAADKAAELTCNHDSFDKTIKELFADAGVSFVIMPNLPGSKTNGATKKMGDFIMLMVNDRRLHADTFWFTLFHEIGHILNGDYGISFDKEIGDKELLADEYAKNKLIPSDSYERFISQGVFTRSSIVRFAHEINRAPGIIVGRLQHEKYIKENDPRYNSLRVKYKVL